MPMMKESKTAVVRSKSIVEVATFGDDEAAIDPIDAGADKR
jgi:hypothetical protein